MAIISCQNRIEEPIKDQKEIDLYPDSKPLARWWWFATQIQKEDVKHQLDWAKEKNFGGVEIAWVYPLYRYQRMYLRKYGRNYPKDTTAQIWLSEEWSDVVRYTKLYADSIGLGVDFTLGSAWPSASANLPKELGTKIYGDSTFQQLLTFSWAFPDTFLVINHLDSNAFNAFSNPILSALKPAITGSKSALFTDSWEIKLNATNKIWTSGFAERFEQSFNYDLIPYMHQLDSFPDVRYDYMLQLDEMVTNGFYKPFVRKCKEVGAYSRVQCLASPTDVMTTYSLVDIPETESMLNNPNYSRIVSSAACLSSKSIVSSETFTCLYGFPATYLREEQTADLKMVADAMFAQGVNQHVYHGMPFNPKGADTIDFFATTYFGPGGSLEEELASFNQYIANVSEVMKKGRTYTDVAVYIPYEDGVMKGAYPPERQRVWVWGEYEMRYIEPPKELEGYHPLWINRHFLENARFHKGRLEVGDASFSMVYVDVKYMDQRALRRLVELAKQGMKICLKQTPIQPGKNKSNEYKEHLRVLKSLKNVSNKMEFLNLDNPLISGDSLPEYWCRVKEDGTHYLFLAPWTSKRLEYPIYSGQSFTAFSIINDFQFFVNGKELNHQVEFKPYQSILLKILPNGKIETLDIEFVPKDPLIREREPQKINF